MTTFAWIVAGGVAMSAIALSGSLTLLWRPETFQRLLLPLVAFAAGTLIGGALFHMLPGALASGAATLPIFGATAAGFVAFFVLEQFLHWRHSHGDPAAGFGKPVTYLVLIGDGIHNLLGGLAVAGAFVADVRLGLGAWLAAAVHEVPQELGDFAVLVHSGWSRRRALVFNLVPGGTFLVGGVLAYVASLTVDVWFLLPFAAGNFLYLGASDLVPEVNRSRTLGLSLLHFGSFAAGLGLLYVLRLVLEH